MRAQHASEFRRTWVWTDEPPHFFDHRIDAFKLVDGDLSSPLLRGFSALQLIRPGDRVLDVGCGDGFFTARFFATVAAHVDGIDLEVDAIEHANRHNARPNVAYHVVDATVAPFPYPTYDVVVFDGALGHFTAEATDAMIAKIASAVGDGGFAGSESLGIEDGHDHLQHFADLDALAAPFLRHFAHVETREITYPLRDGTTRREGFWRCSQQPDRLAAGWRRYER